MTDGTPRVVELPATRAAPRLGREFVRTVLAAWRLDALTDTAVLLASELVTNAVVHARTPCTLRVEQRPRVLRVSVVDGGAGIARRGAARSGVAGGHGLALVETLARRWGSRRVDGGHEVWFDLDTQSVGAQSTATS